MATCRQCNGTGYETYEEDGRQVTDACYHCGTTGEVSEEEDFRDRLHAVAAVLSYNSEQEYRRACDSDPDGDGYELMAAENGFRSYDYFRVRVWEKTEEIMQQLIQRPMADQQLLVAWNEAKP